MKRVSLAALFCFAPTLLWTEIAAQAASGPEKHVLGQGRNYETPYYIFPGHGPVILFEGGIHGSELAGTYALDRLVGRSTSRVPGSS